MKKHTGLIFLILVTGLFFPACDSATNSDTQVEEEPEEVLVGPKISFSVDRGSEESNYSLEVDPNGVIFTMHDHLPVKLLLSKQERTEFINRYERFEEMVAMFPDGVNGDCSDGDKYFLEIEHNDFSGSLSAEGCYIFNPIVFNSSETLETIRKMFSLPNSYYGSLLRYGKPTWFDIKFSVNLDANEYEVGDPITFKYEFHNPGFNSRSVYLPLNTDPFWVHIWENDDNEYYFRFSELTPQIDQYGNDWMVISLEPNETKEFAFVWDQKVERDGSEISITPGRYNLRTALIAGYSSLWGTLPEYSFQIRAKD